MWIRNPVQEANYLRIRRIRIHVSSVQGGAVSAGQGKEQRLRGITQRRNAPQKPRSCSRVARQGQSVVYISE
jgi:hypothetical protein